MVTARLIVTGAKQGIANSRRSWDRLPVAQCPCRSVPVPPGRRALEARDGGAFGGRVRPLFQRQRLDRAVEAVTARAPDMRALQRAVRRPHHVAALDLGG